MPYPTTLQEVDSDLRIIRRKLRQAGLTDRMLRGIETRALRSGRRQTGQYKSNREPRWKLDPGDPQYGAELDCKIILIKLLGSLYEFANAPAADAETWQLLETRYFFRPLQPGTMRDALLLETFDFNELVAEGANPQHGHSNFHIGHQDPTIQPKHTPDNISWRSHRSNLIQGNMTLRQSRIYFVKLIARYFELGELNME